MGLFIKKDPAKEKLKKLTGGLLPSTSFIELIRSHGLETDDAIDIHQQMKQELKEGSINIDTIEERLEFLIFKRKEASCIEIICGHCDTPNLASSNFCISCGNELNNSSLLKTMYLKKEIAFLSNFNHNTRTCPQCGVMLLKNHPFCYSCGFDLTSIRDVRFSRLEEMYNSAISKKYSPEFRVDYVLYLNSFTKKVSKNFSHGFNVDEDSLKSQAISEEFIEYGSPLISARKSTVNDLKEILKSHGLKVSGKKEELIERLGENLDDSELERYFPEKSYRLSQKGFEFLSKNYPIIYIYENDALSSVVSSKDIVRLFEEKSYSMNDIYDVLLAHLLSLPDDGQVISALISIYEDMSDESKILEYRIKLFISDLNIHHVKLDGGDMLKLTESIRRAGLSIDELKEVFENAYDDLNCEKRISKPDSFIYLLRIFNGEDSGVISDEINVKFH